MVGDPDQAIYGFRGAAPDIFLRFQADYPDALLLRLETNYRSSATILAAAQAVILQSASRIDKTLNPVRPAGQLVELRDFATDQQEAGFIAREIERLMGGMRFESLGSGEHSVTSFREIAVLYRLHQQGRVLNKALESRGIPVSMAATRSIFEQPATHAIVAVLEVLAHPEKEMALSGLLTDSPLAVSPAVLGRLQAAAAGSRLVEKLADPPFACAEPVRKRLQALAELIDCSRQKAAGLPLDRLIADIRDALFAAAEKTDEYFALLTAAMAFADMPAAQAIPLFLEKAALLQDGETCSTGHEAVRLMTVHGAKGLEFPVIFIAGFEQGLLPYLSETDSCATGDIEEERRLLYVAMTRAQDRLYVSASRSRFLFGERKAMARSCFATDIPEQLCRCLSHKAPQKIRQKQLKLFA